VQKSEVRGCFGGLQQSRSGAGVLWVLQWSLNLEYISLQRSAVDLAQTHNFAKGESSCA